MASIINFSDAATIGIHSMIILCREGKPLNAIELSEKINKSKHHIGKVLQRLVKMGYLESQRGPTGGFKVVVDPATISMYDIYSAIEGPVNIKECEAHGSICPQQKCIFKNVVGHLSTTFINYMKNESLSEYIKTR